MANPISQPARRTRRSTAHDREDSPLRQQLPRDSESAGAKRDANGDFLLPGGRPGKQQVRDIAAADQENERDRAEQDHQRPLYPDDQLAMQRLYVHPVTLVQLRKFRFEPGGNRVHFRLRLGQRDAVLEPGHDEHVVPAAIEVKRLGDRRPDVRRASPAVGGNWNVGRHDPDHGMARR